ncbi:MAG: hypothetical protein A2275_18445 [Bacteroidetes bacterium RIFOXYA12_FULL_35_11]|nr:MAG: hypothetical protein A2X01_11360 [Bacteroidetes bacterium GWF2_35_48]OFY82781.1 MAG: hypothetical protein A2275_18445 [Bacteroidetes bacterium RIFOXYA12_FULL_35_11]OFZ00288.1 MAG: hypothetical protein A2491_04195 [Bacteroidetes bacterium RIFOXYC12_FULL_35_7]HBX51359.1 hypothetical protein [Bacteroidales bacterium]
MRKIFVLAVLISQVLILAAQPKNCTNPISNDEFQLKLNEINAKQNEAKKLEHAKRMLGNVCLLASQVKQMAGIFSNDVNRLDFAKAAYTSTFDKSNFYEVYDSFGYFSYVFKLHDYIAEVKGGNSSNTSTNTIPQQNINVKPTETTPNYPRWDFPNATTYNGLKGCTTPLSDKDFDGLAMQVFRLNSDPEKNDLAEKTIQGNCLTTTHIMKLASFINSNTDKLFFLKKAIYRCYDVENFTKAEQCLSAPGPKKMLNDEINKAIAELKAANLPKKEEVKPCEILNKEFLEIKDAIKKQNFNNTRVTIAKQIISSQKCPFTSFQIKEIVKLFDFEDSRLDVAKFAWDFCMDKQFYFKVHEALDFDVSKTELSKYTSTKK